jgi:hypothetical protein
LAIRCKSPQCQEELLYPTQQFSVITSSAPIEFAIPLPVPKESGVSGRDDHSFAVVVREILLRNQRDFTSDLPRTHTKQAKKKKKKSLFEGSRGEFKLQDYAAAIAKLQDHGATRLAKLVADQIVRPSSGVAGSSSSWKRLASRSSCFGIRLGCRLPCSGA